MRQFLSVREALAINGEDLKYHDVKTSRAIAERYMGAIRRHAGNDALSADQVHVRGMWLCNSQRDYYYSRFSLSALDEVAELLPGRPVMTGHNYSQLPVGRFFQAKVEYRDDLKLPRRDSAWVKGLFYVPADAEGEAVVRRIDLGVYKEVSIGWRCLDATCSLCQNQIQDRNACPHVPGELYEEGLCDYEFSGVTSVLEGSLVFSGGQKNTSTFDPGPGGTLDGSGRTLEQILAAPEVDWKAIPALKRSAVADLGEPDTVRTRQLKPSVQKIVCSKGRFEDRAAAARWTRDHEFRADRFDETDESFGFRQFDPSLGREGTFRAIDVDSGVRAVVCKRKEASAPADGPLDKLFEEASAA